MFLLLVEAKHHHARTHKHRSSVVLGDEGKVEWDGHEKAKLQCNFDDLKSTFGFTKNQFMTFDHSEIYGEISREDAETHLNCHHEDIVLGELWQEVNDNVIVDNGETFIGGTGTTGTSRRRGGMAGTLLWPNGVIPYDPATLGDPVENAILHNAWNEALSIIEAYTCLRFREKAPSDRQWMRVLEFGSGSCGAGVGFNKDNDGEQTILLGRGCAKKGPIMHEVLHQAGFLHEQSRFDRDRYITVIYDHMMGARHRQFEKKQTQGMASPYDWASIMHYQSYAFSNSGLPTMVDKSYRPGTYSSEEDELEALRHARIVSGQKFMLSQQDIDQLNDMYAGECTAAVPSNPPIGQHFLRGWHNSCNEVGPELGVGTPPRATSADDCGRLIYEDADCTSHIFNYDSVTKRCQCCTDLSQGWTPGNPDWTIGVHPGVLGQSLKEGEEMAIGADGKAVIKTPGTRIHFVWGPSRGKSLSEVAGVTSGNELFPIDWMVGGWTKGRMDIVTRVEDKDNWDYWGCPTAGCSLSFTMTQRDSLWIVATDYSGQTEYATITVGGESTICNPGFDWYSWERQDLDADQDPWTNCGQFGPGVVTVSITHDVGCCPYKSARVPSTNHVHMLFGRTPVGSSVPFLNDISQWVLGEKGKACRDVCRDLDTECDTGEQTAAGFSHETLVAAFAEVGIDCPACSDTSSNGCRSGEKGTPFVTDAGECWHHQRGKVSQCRRNRSGGRALCYCKGVRLAEQPVAPSIDCTVTDWSEGSCSAVCGGGTKTKTRSVLISAIGGGACPALEATETCNDVACPSGPGRFYEGTRGDVCPAGEAIATEAECFTAFSALALTSAKPWIGKNGGVPVGCSSQNAGRNDLVFNSNTNGRGRGDLTPICKEPETVQPEPVNCVVSSWAEGPCSASCGDGTKVSTRQISVHPANGGAECPSLEETTSCSAGNCPVDCVVSGWEEGPCSASCGDGTKTKTRIALRPASDGGQACPTLEETVSCHAGACGSDVSSAYEGTRGQLCPPWEAIKSKADCETAHSLLGLKANSPWAGDNARVSGGCSNAKNARGRNNDLHFNSNAGSPRGDLTPICLRKEFYEGTRGQLCPAGEAIESMEVCEAAHTQLGLKQRTPWDDTHAAVPGGCSNNRNARGRNNDLHFNHNASGPQRKHLTPICIRNDD